MTCRKDCTVCSHDTCVRRVFKRYVGGYILLSRMGMEPNDIMKKQLVGVVMKLENAQSSQGSSPIVRKFGRALAVACVLFLSCSEEQIEIGCLSNGVTSVCMTKAEYIGTGHTSDWTWTPVNSCSQCK